MVPSLEVEGVVEVDPVAATFQDVEGEGDAAPEDRGDTLASSRGVGGATEDG